MSFGVSWWTSGGREARGQAAAVRLLRDRRAIDQSWWVTGTWGPSHTHTDCASWALPCFLTQWGQSKLGWRQMEVRGEGVLWQTDMNKAELSSVFILAQLSFFLSAELHTFLFKQQRHSEKLLRLCPWKPPPHPKPMSPLYYHLVHSPRWMDWQGEESVCVRVCVGGVFSPEPCRSSWTPSPILRDDFMTFID